MKYEFRAAVTESGWVEELWFGEKYYKKEFVPIDEGYQPLNGGWDDLEDELPDSLLDALEEHDMYYILLELKEAREGLSDDWVYRKKIA